MKPRLIAILGPTASGKSSLGIALARQFNGEIVSADSRQVYRGLDIGTGKITPEEQALVPHHLLDVVDAGDDFSVAEFQKRAFGAIDDIHGRGKLPFLVGGTALYAYAVVDNYRFVDVKPNVARRRELEGKSMDELIVILSEAKNLVKTATSEIHPRDPSTRRVRLAQDDGLNESDSRNPRRLIRAIEKLEAGAPLEPKKGPPKYNALLLAIDVPREELYKKIDSRVDERLKHGMIEEVERLRMNGVSDDWLINLGLEYRHITKYLQNKCRPEAGQPLAEKHDEMAARLKGAIHAFARRQMTWWRRDKRIVRVRSEDEARKKVTRFFA